MAPKRPRNDVPTEEVASIAEPHVTSVEWIEYDDNFDKAACKPELIKKLSQMWKDLLERSGGNLRFPKKKAEAFMTRVLEIKRDASDPQFLNWTPQQEKEWMRRHFKE